MIYLCFSPCHFLQVHQSIIQKRCPLLSADIQKQGIILSFDALGSIAGHALVHHLYTDQYKPLYPKGELKPTPPGSPDYTDPLREAAIRSRLETVLLANMAGLKGLVARAFCDLTWALDIWGRTPAVLIVKSVLDPRRCDTTPELEKSIEELASHPKVKKEEEGGELPETDRNSQPVELWKSLVNEPGGQPELIEFASLLKKAFGDAMRHRYGPELRDFDGVGKFWGVPLDRLGDEEDWSTLDDDLIQAQWRMMAGGTP